MGIIWSEDYIEREPLFFVLFCTQLTIDLILRPRGISRLGIHPYRFYYTCRDLISMDDSFYSILPSKVKISLFLFKWTANSEAPLVIIPSMSHLQIYSKLTIKANFISLRYITTHFEIYNCKIVFSASIVCNIQST